MSKNKAIVLEESYLMGISEGRRYMSEFNPSIERVNAVIVNLNDTMKQFPAGPIKQMLRGELDFWKNHLKDRK